MKRIFILYLALILSGGLFGCSNKPGSALGKYAENLRAAVPADWIISASNNVFRIESSRDVWLLGPNLPGSNGYTDEQYAKNFGVKTKYQIVLTFAPKLSPEEYQRLREMRRPYEQVPQGMLPPGSASQRAQEAQVYLGQHPLPKFYNDDYSILVESPADSNGIYPPEAAKQGEQIITWLKNNFGEYKN
jgi:hypothetical protein